MSVASLSARAVSGAAWTYASFAAGRLLVVAGLAIVARLVGPEQYGLFAMAAVGIYFLEGTYDFGLTRGLICFGGEYPPRSLLRTGFVLAVCLGGAISVALFALAPAVAAFYGDPRLQLVAITTLIPSATATTASCGALTRQRARQTRQPSPSTSAPPRE